MCGRALLMVVLLGGLPCVGIAEEETLRDPFWPVGYSPKAEEEEAMVEEEPEPSPFNFDNLTPEEQALIRKNLTVSGVLKQGSSYFAFVNNEVVRAGDILPLRVGTLDYRFKVLSITQNNINLEPIRTKKNQPQTNPSLGENE